MGPTSQSSEPPRHGCSAKAAVFGRRSLTTGVSDMTESSTGDITVYGALTTAGAILVPGAIFWLIQIYFLGSDDPAIGRDDVFKLMLLITFALSVASMLAFFITLPLYYVLAMPRSLPRIILQSIAAALLILGFIVSGVPTQATHDLVGTWHSSGVNLLIILGIMIATGIGPFLVVTLTHFAIWKAQMRYSR